MTMGFNDLGEHDGRTMTHTHIVKNGHLPQEIAP